MAEEWSYSNWAVNLDDGVIDQDPRDNTQPNDSGDEEGSQPIMGFGEMNEPVPTWGDYMGRCRHLWQDQAARSKLRFCHRV